MSSNLKPDPSPHHKSTALNHHTSATMRTSPDNYDNEAAGTSNGTSQSKYDDLEISFEDNGPNMSDDSDPLAHKWYSSGRWSARTLILFSFVLALLVCIQNFIGTFSCTNDSFTHCYSQYTLRFRDTSESRALLSGAREGLRMASYFAKDFSVTLNDGHRLSEKIKYIDTIDTFTNKNVYKFNFHGFCRQPVVSGKDSCTYINGLDVFGSLVKDVGIQLGVVSNAEDPLDVGTSLSTAYSSSVVTLDQYFAPKKNSNPRLEKGAGNEVEKAKESYFAKARQMTEFGHSMAIASTVSMVVSVILLMVQGNVLLALNSSPSLQLNVLKIIIAPMVLAFVQLIVSLTILFGEVRFCLKMNRFLNNFPIADFSRASGFYIVVSTTLLNIALQSSLIMVYYRK